MSARGRAGGAAGRHPGRRTMPGRTGATLAAVALGCAALLAAPSARLGAQSSSPAILSEAPLAGRSVEFHAVIHPDTVYVGQQANYQVGVFLGADVRARLRRNPEFVPPEMAGVLGYDLPVAHVLVPDRAGGRYEAHVFERAVFPLTAGVHEIPAARLSYSLPLNRSFFSREESFLLRTEPVRLVALPAPAAGRPPDFDGAIGSGLDIVMEVDSGAAARVGDPLLVTARVSGRGNVNLFPRPRLEVPWATAVATGERVTLDTTTRVIGGIKEFDWLLTPRRDGSQRLPAVSYPYFDPERAAYRAAAAVPETVHVAAGTLAALDSAPAAASRPLPLRERWRGPVPLPPARSPAYWLAIALLPLASLAVRFGRRRPRQRPLPSAARQLAELAGAAGGAAGGIAPGPSIDARGLRTLFLRAIAERLALPALPGGDSRAFVRALRLEGVSADVALAAAALLAELDGAAFGLDADRARRWPGSLIERATSVVSAVDSEARRGPGTPGARPRSRAWSAITASGALALVAGGVAAALLGAGSAGASASARQPGFAPAPAASVVFGRGVALYRAGDFADAHQSFASVAERLPRASDAWANAGTAAWAAGDTVGAAVGWQRALRLEPGARDVRQRLALLPGDQLGGAAAVPPLSPALLQWLVLVAWGVAAALALRSAIGGGPLLTAGVSVLLGIAVLGGGGAALVGERLAARDLAVVADGAVLRSQPALAAAVRRPLAAGEVVRIRARAGVWSRIQVDGDGGWVERSRLRELRAD